MADLLGDVQFSDKHRSLLLTLSAFFVGFFVAAEILGGKLWSFTIFGLRPSHLGLAGESFVATTGIFSFPLTFILTDIINEYYGRKAVRTLTFLAIAVNLVLQPVVQAAMRVPTVSFNPEITSDRLHWAYATAWGQTTSLVFASVTAFGVSQLIDVRVFHWLRLRTGGRLLWLRAQGSTLISQLIDTITVIFLAFVFIPRFLGDTGWTLADATRVSLTNYFYKFLIAVGITPILYAVHFAVDRWLGHQAAEKLAAEAHTDPTLTPASPDA